MRVKLIYPPSSKVESEPFRFPPAALTVVASYLKQNGVDVYVDDLEAEVNADNQKGLVSKKVNLSIFDDRESVKRFLNGKKDIFMERQVMKLLSKFEYNNFDLIGFSMRDFSDYSMLGSALAMSKFIREKNEGTKFVYGGLDNEEVSHQLMEFDVCDFIVVNRGELPLLSLCKALEQGKDLKNVPNIIYKKNGKLVRTRGYVGNVFVCPDFSTLNLGLYRKSANDIFSSYNYDASLFKGYKTEHEVLVLPYQFIVGCPNKCIFCCESQTKEFFLKKPEVVVDELKYLSRRYNTRYFYFINTNFNISYDYADKLCEEMISKKLNILWSDCAHFKNMDEELLRKTKEAGAIKLIWGLESGSDKMLKFVDKGITSKMATDLLKLSHELGIWNQVEFIIGLPHETDEDVDATIKFIKDNKEYIDVHSLNPFSLYPASELGFYPEKYGIEILKRQEEIDWLDEDNIDSFVGIYSVGFNEVNGLKWRDKAKKIKEDEKKVVDFIRSIDPPVGIDSQQTYLLFFLYEIFKYDKEKIREAIRVLCKKVKPYNGNLFLEPPFYSKFDYKRVL